MSKWKEFFETFLLFTATLSAIESFFSWYTKSVDPIKKILHIPDYFPLVVILALSYFIVSYSSWILLRISPKARAKKLGRLVNDFVNKVKKEGRSPQARSELLYFHGEALKLGISFPDDYEIEDILSNKFFEEIFYYLSLIYPFLEKGDIEGAKTILVVNLL